MHPRDFRLPVDRTAREASSFEVPRLSSTAPKRRDEVGKGGHYTGKLGVVAAHHRHLVGVARSGNPNFANLVGGTFGFCFWIDNQKMLFCPDLSTAYQRARILIILMSRNSQFVF